MVFNQLENAWRHSCTKTKIEVLADELAGYLYLADKGNLITPLEKEIYILLEAWLTKG